MECNCKFVDKVKVIFKKKRYPAQIWEAPSGDKYYRIFYNPENKKLYWRVSIDQAEILDYDGALL